MPAAALTCCIYSSSAYVPRPYTVIKSITVAASWSPAHSKKLYKVDSWGAPYFSINSNGNVSVRPYGDTTLPHQEIDLLSVVSNANDALELNAPLIVRFPDVLNDRLESLQAAFNLAIQSQGYGAHYHGIYPVKCNQDRYVVDDIVRFGFGLEVGSKPELLLAMSCLCKYGTRPDAFLVCNGFKDADYVSLAILAKKLHLNVVIVLEQEEELDMVIEVSRKLGAPRPVIGLRAKLRTKHDGHFGSTSGEKGKFGLTTSQIVRVVKKLKLNNMVDCLQFLHFHIGSQIPSTSILSDGVSEAAQIYSELVRLGATNMKVIDVGGGLGIDYDGSRSQDSDMSVAYNLEEYAAAVVEAVGLVCNRNGVKHPILCSESGRAIVSHHSVLVFEAASEIAPANNNLSLQHLVNVLPPEINALINHDHSFLLTFADQFKQRCVDQFKQGSLSIEQLAAVDGLCELVSSFNGGAPDIRTYDINLSIFTSLPDFWAIGQLFPIIPIHRHDKKPTLRGILSDLTCDSDGKIDKFIGGESSLPLHEQGEEKYHLGVFLAGAYQEALGGFHNLFGCPNIVCVEQSDEAPDGFIVKTTLRGNSCAEVLRIMNHEPQHMFQAIKQRIEEVSGDGYSSIALVNAVACSFNTLPYLDLGNNAYYTLSDKDFVTNDDATVEERLTPTSDLYYVRGPV